MVKKNVRQLAILHTAVILISSAQGVHASNIGVDLNINIGNQPRQVIVAEPVYAPPAPVVVVDPVYAPPAPVVLVEHDVDFIFPQSLGFYVAVGVPYDLFYLRNSYFMFSDGRWLRAPSSRGPWVVQRYRDLPPTLLRHRLERVREYRDREYGVYRRDRDHYRGRHFRRDREEWKEQQREMKAQRHDQRMYEKEQRRENKRFEKEERREHRGGRGD